MGRICRWSACAGLPMVVGALLVACAEGQGQLAGGQVADSRAQQTIDKGSAAAAMVVTQGVDTSANGMSDEEAPTTNAVGNAESEGNGVVEKDARTVAVTGQEGAVEEQVYPQAGDGAGAEPPTTAPSESASDGPETGVRPVAPVSVAGVEALPAAKPVTGADVKLDGVLLGLVRARRGGGAAGVLAYVERYQPGMAVDSLRVQIVCESADKAAAVRDQLVGAGGTVTTSFANYIWAEVPFDQIEALAATEAVWTIGVSQAFVQPGVR